MLSIFAEVKRVLKPSGSFWLNIGDAYSKKCLLGLPWRVALAMIDRQGWVLRNSVVWNKVKAVVPGAREKIRPTYLWNLEQLVRRHLEWREGTYANAAATIEAGSRLGRKGAKPPKSPKPKKAKKHSR